MTIQKVIDWCDAQVAQEQEVALRWEGGGDSGWVYLTVDGEEVSCDEATWLIDQMYEQLDYGSWAGEFSANGDATYDPETKEFVGIDSYSEDEHNTLQLSEEDFIEIRVPGRFYFDTIEIEYDNILDGGNVSIGVTTRNGIISNELVTYLESLEEGITNASVAKLQANIKEDINGGWQHIVFQKENAEIDEAKQDYIFKIKELDYYDYLVEEKSMNINLIEMLEDENN